MGLSRPTSYMGIGISSYLGEMNSVSQVDEDSDVVPTCWFCGVELSKGSMASANNASIRRTIQLLPICPWHLLSCCLSIESQNN